jgi:hypothetical protein
MAGGPVRSSAFSLTQQKALLGSAAARPYSSAVAFTWPKSATIANLRGRAGPNPRVHVRVRTLGSIHPNG